MWAAEVRLSKDIELGLDRVVKGTKVVITQGFKEDYSIWFNNCFWDVPRNCINEQTLNVQHKFYLK